MDEALIGRFALFLYPPDVLRMEEQNRIQVTTHINGDDAPGLSVWLNGKSTANTTHCKTVLPSEVEKIGQQIQVILHKAADIFLQLKSQLHTLSDFLSKFAVLLLKESDGEITLDGRRLGFMYRNLLANRAIELAKLNIQGIELPEFSESAKYVVQSSIPVGLNDESVNREETIHKMDICFDLLKQYFDRNAEISIVNRIYELFTTDDLLRKAEILLQGDLGEFVASKAWNTITSQEEDISLLAYTVFQVEVHRPGTVPQELFEHLSQKITPDALSSRIIPEVRNKSIQYLDEIEALFEQPTIVGKIAAFARVKQLVKKEDISLSDIQNTAIEIDRDVQTFHALMQNTKPESTTGGES